MSSQAQKDRDARWMALCQQRVDTLWKTACSEYLEGFGALDISLEQAPLVEAINLKLEALTGWRFEPVEELIPAASFFELLASKRFPAMLGLREEHSDGPDERPDLFHDIMGHAPMLAEPLVADFMQRCGELGGQEGTDLCALINIFWFTVEMGLVREGPNSRVFGATLASSLAHARRIKSGEAEVLPFDLERVIAAPLSLDAFPAQLFVLRDLEDLEVILSDFEARSS